MRASSRSRPATPGATLTFAREAAADVRVEHVAMGDRGSRFRLKTPSGESAVIALPLPGSPSGLELPRGVRRGHRGGRHRRALRRSGAAPRSRRPPRRDAAARLGRASLRRRLQREPPIDARRSRHAALLPGKRKIAVLGDMRELGPESEWWHRETGRYVIGRADRLICVGPLGRYLGGGRDRIGLPPVGGPRARLARAGRQSARLHARLRRHGPLQGIARRRAREDGRATDRARPAARREGASDALLLALSRSRGSTRSSTSSATSRSGRRWRR